MPDGAAVSDSPLSTKPTRRPAFGCLLEIVETVVLTVLIFLGIQAFVAQPYQVQQVSMEQTLEPEQYVLVDKLSPRWSAYARGDIVVFDAPASATLDRRYPFIKRVIGVPGDHIQLRDGKVVVNGKPIAEPYIYREADGTPQRTDSAFGGTSDWVVPAGDVFVLGDHRAESSDSRVFGPVEASHLIGRAWLRYWPLNAFEVLAKPSQVP